MSALAEKTFIVVIALTVLAGCGPPRGDQAAELSCAAWVTRSCTTSSLYLLCRNDERVFWEDVNGKPCRLKGDR